MTKAEEIRLASSKGILHPLVRDNWASPRGICNCSDDLEGGTVYCTLDFGHIGEHVNGGHRWQMSWPPDVFEVEGIVNKASDHIEPGALCCKCHKEPATFATRLVTRDDTMPFDALLWGGATCWDCAKTMARRLDIGPAGET